MRYLCLPAMVPVILSAFCNTPLPAAPVVVDNDSGSPAYVEGGGWSTSASPGYNGGTYRYAAPSAPNTATFQGSLPYANARWEVSSIWKASTNRCSSTVYKINAADQVYTATVNQQVNDLSWVPLGTYTFAAGNNKVTLDAGASSGGSVVIADAVRFSLAPGQFQKVEDFESGTAGGEVMFRDPLFSGSTTGVNTSMASGSEISTAQANNMVDSNAGTPGTKSHKFYWTWSTAGQGSVRTTTNNAASRPNPILDLTKGLGLYVKVVRGTVDLGMFIRETGVSGAIGGNGGASGVVEELVTRRRLAPSANWQYVYFNLPTEGYAAVSGNGVLNGTHGTLESLIFKNVSSNTDTQVEIYVDDIYQGIQQIPAQVTVQPAVTYTKTLTNAPFYNLAPYYNGTVLFYIPAGFRKTATVDYVYYFHGFGTNVNSAIADFQIRQQMEYGNKNAILVMPETAVNARDGTGGRLDFTSGFTYLVNEVASTLKNDGYIDSTTVGNIVLAGHSGAYQVMANIINVGGSRSSQVKELYLFDAVYGGESTFTNFYRNDTSRKINSIGTPSGYGTIDGNNRFKSLLSSYGISYYSKDLRSLSGTAGKEIKLTDLAAKINFIYNNQDHYYVVHEFNNFGKMLQQSRLFNK